MSVEDHARKAQAAIDAVQGKVGTVEIHVPPTEDVVA